MRHQCDACPKTRGRRGGFRSCVTATNDDDIKSQIRGHSVSAAIEFHVKRLKQAASERSAGSFTDTESTENMIEHVLNINRTGDSPKRSRRVPHTFRQ